MIPPVPFRAAVVLTALLLLAPCFLGANGPAELSISDGNWSLLTQGDPVVLAGTGGKERKALAAIIVPFPASAVWGVIEDKEGAVDWVEGLRAAKITESGENYALVYQELKVGFLPGTFKYVIRHTDTEHQRRIDFKRESGSFKSLEGYWELYPIEGGSRTLALYQLAIDPGMPIPAAVIRDSLAKSLPDALVGLRNQVGLVQSAQASVVPQ